MNPFRWNGKRWTAAIVVALLGGIALGYAREYPESVATAERDLYAEVKAIASRVASRDTYTIVFTGDVMLGRNVRNLMRANGSAYPFANVVPIFDGVDAVVINLEGPITTLNAPDPRVSPEQPWSMRFAFDSIAADELADAGVTHVSLANNHSWDQGKEGYEDTRIQLERVGIKPLPYIDEKHHIAFVGIDATLAPIDFAAVKQQFDAIGPDTTIVAFMHWGNEYETTHSAAQEAIARELIADGADLIIGSHPHVVQDIQVYDGVPVFYSLGNFIFDQYWNDDVESGLAIRVTFRGDDLSFELIPIDGNHSQPTMMGEAGQKAFLAALAERSDASLF